jgi:hypothetical protein
MRLPARPDEAGGRLHKKICKTNPIFGGFPGFLTEKRSQNEPNRP